MGDQMTTQAVVVDAAKIDPNAGVLKLALFNEDGSPLELAGIDVSDLQDEADAAAAAITALQAKIVTATSATVIGTAAKVVATAEPAANSIVMLKLTNGNSASSPTVAFNGGAARAIQLGGVAAAGAKCTVAANGVVPLWFDGTVLHMFGTIA